MSQNCLIFRPPDNEKIKVAGSTGREEVLMLVAGGDLLDVNIELLVLTRAGDASEKVLP